MGNIHLILGIYSICMFVLVVLWLQSGIDKIFNYKDNYSWLQGHFAKSALKNIVPFMLIMLTLFELSSGIVALLAIGEIWIYQTCRLPFWACGLSLLSLASLFAGQRIAKDYAGAASLMGYFSYVLLVLIFTIWTWELMFDIKYPFSEPGP